jgi:hypothetical protein
MRSNTKKLQTILVAVLLLVVTMSIGYAALSTTLTITGNNVVQAGLTWNIGFTGSSVTGVVKGGTSNTGRDCKTASITSSSVTLTDGVQLSKPGDKCSYTLNIKNNGSIAGVLYSITPSEPASTSCTKTNATSSASAQMVCGNLTYKLAASDDGATALPTGSTLAINGTKTVYLVIEYTGTDVHSTQINQAGGKFTIVYNQA